MSDAKFGSTKDIAGLTASLCIGADFALHFYNYGIPPLESATLTNASGMQVATTVGGAITTATVSGITSEDLEDMIDKMPEPYDRLVARASVASAFTSAKTLAQGAVLLAYSFVVPNGRAEAMLYASKQLVPALLVNSAIAFGIPYSYSN
jgi:hypothetical protein